MPYEGLSPATQNPLNLSDSAPTKLNGARDGFGSGLRGNNPLYRADGLAKNDCVLLVKIVSKGGTPPTRDQMLSGLYNYNPKPGGGWIDSARNADAYGILAYGTAGEVKPMCEELRG